MKVIECRELTPSQGQTVISVENPKSLMTVYGNGEDIIIFKVGKDIRRDTEYWVIGEQISVVYVGDDFEEKMKSAAKDFNLEYSC